VKARLRSDPSPSFLQLASSDVPKCSRCGSAMKMDVVLFGEALQYSVLQEAMRAATQADVILVVGTSLTVSTQDSTWQRRGLTDGHPLHS
jgi:NAD-dependent SIR2 family protein deacetylase